MIAVQSLYAQRPITRIAVAASHRPRARQGHTNPFSPLLQGSGEVTWVLEDWAGSGPGEIASVTRGQQVELLDPPPSFPHARDPTEWAYVRLSHAHDQEGLVPVALLRQPPRHTRADLDLSGLYGRLLGFGLWGRPGSGFGGARGGSFGGWVLAGFVFLLHHHHYQCQYFYCCYCYCDCDGNDYAYDD